MSQQDVPVFSVQTALATASDSKDSLDGIDLALGQYESGTVAYVRATNTYYYYDAASAAVPDGVTVVQPLSGPGRWLLLSASVGGDCAVIRVAQDGSGDFTTIEAALAFANANATVTEPYTLVVCPGQYTPAATLPFTNQYVSMRAAMPMTVSVVAAVGVTPLIQLGSASVSPFPAQCFDGLVLLRQDGDVGVIVAITNGDTGFVFFRECMFLGDSATGILANPTNSTTIICHESFAVGLSSTDFGGGLLDISGSSSVVWSECPCFAIGRFATIKSNLSSVNCTTSFIDSLDASTTVRVEAGLFQCSNTILSNSSGVAAWNVLCDGPSAQARLSDVQCDLGGLSARQYTAFGGHATIRAVGCVVENATTALDVDDGYIYALGCKVMNAGTVVAIGGLNAPRIFVEGGDVPIAPGAAAIPGLIAYTGDQETNGDALVCYNGTAPAQQLRLDQTFVPADSADVAGVVGNIAWGSSGGTDYIYVKFPGGWRRVAMVAF